MNIDLLNKIAADSVQNTEAASTQIVQPTDNVIPITEFVGSTQGDTVGLVIANLDTQLRKGVGLKDEYSAIGFVSARTGGAPHIFAADDAVKATNTEIVSIQLARDCKGGAGQGATIIFAAKDVSDARRAVEIMLEAVDKHFGDVFFAEAGHIEFHYTSRASYALNHMFGAEVGKSFGIIVGGPAALGLIMADYALKAADVELVNYLDVESTGWSNQIIITVTGDSGAVKQSVSAAREVGVNVFKSMGNHPVAQGKATF